MDFNDTPEEAAFRAEGAGIPAANAEPKAGHDQCRGRATSMRTRCALQRMAGEEVRCGICRPYLAERFGGREASPILQVIYNQEEENYAVPRGLYEIGLGMCIPTMMAYANLSSSTHVRPAVRGEEVWCQLF